MRLIEEISGDTTLLNIDGLIPDTDYTFQVLTVKSGVEVSAAISETVKFSSPPLASTFSNK